MRGCKNIAANIASRKKAIQKGIKELKDNETLLIAGKGHETTQDYGSKIINFSDKKVVKDFKIKNKGSKNKIFNKINYSGVSINTKTIKKNNLFFAIKGKNNDGHNFVKKAISLGAKKTIVSKEIRKISNKKIIKVKNTLSTLNDLAKVTRNKSNAKIIGITGSAGKTTLKNLVGFALKRYG